MVAKMKNIKSLAVCTQPSRLTLRAWRTLALTADTRARLHTWQASPIICGLNLLPPTSDIISQTELRLLMEERGG